jgi:hypothetical protein
MALDFNDPDLEFSDLVYAYQSWVMAVINDEKLEGEETLLSEEIAEDALDAMRFLPANYRRDRNQPGPGRRTCDPEELASLLFPED